MILKIDDDITVERIITEVRMIGLFDYFQREHVGSSQPDSRTCNMELYIFLLVSRSGTNKKLNK